MILLELFQSNFKTPIDVLALLPMTIEVHLSYSFLFAAKDGEDGRKTPKIKYE